MSKFGHVTGTKQEKNGASDWYKAIEAQHIARIEAADDAERALVTALATQVGNAVAALPAAAARIAKAARLVQKKDCWKLSDGSFLVGSQSDDRAAHLVTRHHGWQCDCHFATYRKELCSHQIAAMLVIKIGTAYQACYN